MEELFVAKKFSDTSMAIIGQARLILREYASQGFDLSLRQLYYQFVSRGWLPNSQQNYKRLGSIINDGRLAGVIDWAYIKDRGRETLSLSHWDNPAEILESAARSYHIDKWAGQSERIIVMVEKQALEGVLAPVCRELDITFAANKGYSSASTMYEIGKELGSDPNGRQPVILYLGDHDPSGIDMTRDVKERLDMFSGCDVTVERLALNMDQVEKYNPPPNPAKESDARFAGYQSEFGDTCWELDALNPTVLASLVRSAVLSWRDEDAWNEAVAQEEDSRDALLKYAKAYKRAHNTHKASCR